MTGEPLHKDSTQPRPARFGGQVARRWRRSVARLATSASDERTFTLKFPLDTLGRAVAFEPAAAQYNVVEGIREGSLFAFVSGLHLAGFRLFTSVAEASTFRQKSGFDSAAFGAMAEAHLGIAAPGFTGEAIANFLSAKPRKGLDQYGADDLARRLYYKFAGKRMDDKADAGLAEACQGIAAALTGCFSSWEGLYADKSATVGTVDAWLQAVSPQFPSLMPLVSGTGSSGSDTPVAWAGSPSPALAQADTVVWMHLCVARYLPVAREAGGTASKLAPAVQNLILSAQDNGLSWLFNKGLDYFRDVPTATICADYGVPQTAAWAVDRLKALAMAIAPPAFNDLPHYSAFRKTFAGKHRSWIANYLNRLEELAALFSGSGSGSALPPECFRQAQSDDLFNGLDDVIQAWAAGVGQIPDLFAVARAALARLCGEEPGAAEGDVGRIEDTSKALDYVNGFEQMLLARIEQREGELASKPYGADLLKWRTQRQDALARIPKLQRISGELPDLAQEQASRTDLINRMLALQSAWAARVAGAVGESLDGVLSAMARAERSGLAKHPRAQEWLEPHRLQELAARRFLSGVVAMSRRLSPAGRERLIVALRGWKVVTDKRLFNGWVINRRGQIYRSPWSTARHEALPIRPYCWQQAGWLESLAGLFPAPGVGTDKVGTSELGDWLQVQQFLLRSRVACLTEQQPASLLEGLDLDALNPAPQLRMALAKPTLAPADLRRMTGLLQGEVTRVTQDCLRPQLMVRVKVQFIESNELLYVPKARGWAVPQRYCGQGTPVGRALAQWEAGPEVQAHELAARLFPKRKQGDLEGDAGELLRQVPHDWYLPSRLRATVLSEPWDRHGMAIGKGRSSASPGKDTPVLGRLVGVSSFKGALDRALLDDQTKFGEVMLILDQFFDQTLTMRDGRFAVTLTQSSQRVCAAVPITTRDGAPQSEARAQFFDRLVSIDLGERRIGFAVFDLRQYVEHGRLDPVVDQGGRAIIGSVAVPSVRRLIQTVSGYRKVEQASPKIGDRYSKRLEQYRENVTADVCHAIDELCARFGGFPVLESSVRNFEQGARQLDLVYKGVLNRYSFSNVDAHKMVRKEYWFGSDKWLHPYAKVYEWDEATGTYKKKPKDLNLFPGATISPAGTSQTCWKCGRNPLTVLRNLGAHAQVEQGGVVWTDVGNMRLLRGREYTDEELRRGRRQQVNLRMNRPVDAGRWNAKELERYLRMTMRQPQASRRAKDTSQSLYQCVFTDCGSSHHADEGAAVNIGRKFLREKVVRATG